MTICSWGRFRCVGDHSDSLSYVIINRTQFYSIIQIPDRTPAPPTASRAGLASCTRSNRVVDGSKVIFFAITVRPKSDTM